MDLTDGGTQLFLLAALGILWAIALWYADVNTDRKNFKIFMEEVRGMFSEILEKLPDPVVKRTSPIQLAALGEQMAEFLEAREWAARIAPTLVDQVGDLPFEVDEFAANYVEEHKADWERKMASCAFRFGVERRDVSVVLRVALRDALLSFQD